MKVLVTGSEGLIGRKVVAELVRRHHEPVGFDLVLGQDVMDERQLAAEMRPVDAVIHLATPSSPLLFDHNERKCWDHTVGSAYSIIRNFSGLLVLPSSGKVYGGVDRPGREDMPLPPPPTLYASAKRECERICLDAISQGRDNIWIPRIFACYGGDESHKYSATENQPRYASTPYTFARYALAGEELPLYRNGVQRRDFVHIDDVARGLVDILETKSTMRIFNLGTGRGVSFMDLIRIVNEATGGTLAVTTKDAPTGYSDYMVADPSRSQRELSWSAEVSLEDGIARVVRELRQHYL